MATNRFSKPSPLGYQLAAGSTSSLSLGRISPSPQKHPKRTPSGAFTQLSGTQIQELKESFQMLDKDGDGNINEADLAAMLSSLGQDPTPSIISDHLSSVQYPFNLASYLTHLSQHLSLLTPREDLLSAFAAFDDNDDGTVDVGELVDALTTMGQRMSDEEVENALRGYTKRRFVDGKVEEVFRYRDFVDVLAGKEAGEGKE
ncbi:hypothetical protein RUND412_000931 [Rhizina undulata]